MKLKMKSGGLGASKLGQKPLVFSDSGVKKTKGAGPPKEVDFLAPPPPQAIAFAVAFRLAGWILGEGPIQPQNGEPAPNPVLPEKE